MKPEPKTGRPKKDSVRITIYEGKDGGVRYVQSFTVYESTEKVIDTLRKALKLEAGS